MLAPNTVLQDRYRIIRLINQGNMGAVYLAEHTELSIEVALKETFSAGGDAELREQFRREARLLSKLRHPSLPRVIDHFIDGIGQFLVMDYIVGEDLQESLRSNGGPFPVDRVLGWADQLLEVLTYLHSHDEPVIHRDIKPANIKLTPKGKVILLDFGLAKGSTASLQMSFRAATPAYAPFEQVTCQGTDARSDLYALAVTLYQLMTSALPPIALQRSQTIWQGQPDPLVPADKLNARVPTAISQALTQAMSLQANDRPTSADAMRRMLRGAMSNEQPTVTALAAPEIITTAPMASEPRKENNPLVIYKPPPMAVNRSAQRADNLVAPKELQNQPPPPATAPQPARATEAASLPGLARERILLLRIMLGIVALLIVSVVVLTVINRRKPDTTSDSPGTTDTTTKSPSLPADPAMKAFDFDVVTGDAKGNISDRRKGQARYYAEKLPGGVTLDMVEIPGGAFQMGSPANEAGRYNDEGPQHQVTVSPFYMGKFEVTQRQWRGVVSLPKVSRDLNPYPSQFKGDELPVEQVSWDDAMEFCARLSKATGKTYRLPTEAEWEYASRAGATTPFHFGATITPELANYDGNYP